MDPDFEFLYSLPLHTFLNVLLDLLLYFCGVVVECPPPIFINVYSCLSSTIAKKPAGCPGLVPRPWLCACTQADLLIGQT